jgi:hypothetical protein
VAGRPKKQTVDYFPHYTDASEGKTLTILQNRFGNDGYAAWFRLLERLGHSDGHAYCCASPEDWNYLVAKLHVSDISATEILDLLAKLGAIDSDLWSRKIIWCHKFVDGLTEVYRKRKQDLPSMPCISVAETPIPVAEITQSRVEDSKGKDSRGDKVTQKPKEQKREVSDSVLITEDQLGKLIAQFGEEGAKNRIEKLSLYKLSTGRKYQSDFHTILTWDRKDKENGNGHKPGVNPVNPRTLIPRNQYTRPEDLRIPGAIGGRSPGATTPIPPGE